ncbi:MAG: universal stress protein [Haloplanus sp.]
MPKRILVPVDGSVPADAALSFALAEFPDAEMTVLSVVDPTDAGYASVESAPSTFERLQEAARERAESVLDDARETAADRGVEVTTETAVGEPSRAIVRWVEDHDVDQVVVGSHGRRGVSRVLLGSVAESVVRRSPVPVTVVR